jgi:hypothetical protein
VSEGDGEQCHARQARRTEAQVPLLLGSVLFSRLNRDLFSAPTDLFHAQNEGTRLVKVSSKVVACAVSIRYAIIYDLPVLLTVIIFSLRIHRAALTRFAGFEGACARLRERVAMADPTVPSTVVTLLAELPCQVALPPINVTIPAQTAALGALMQRSERGSFGRHARQGGAGLDGYTEVIVALLHLRDGSACVYLCMCCLIVC